MKLNIKLKLILAFTVLIIMTGSIAAVIGTLMINRGILNEVQGKVYADLSSAREILNNRLKEIRIFIEFTSIRDSIKKSLMDNDIQSLMGHLHEVMEMGADNYIPKPFSPDEILGVVSRAIRKNDIKTRDIHVEKTIHENPEREDIIEKEQVLSVLDRTGNDMKFWRALFDMGSAALKDYGLSDEARAAIAAGDINWIRENYEWNECELTDERLSCMKHLLEAER